MAAITKNNTSYQSHITALIKKTMDDKKSTPLARALKYYQWITTDFATNPKFDLGKPGNARGILIDHDMGTGKTITGSAIMIVSLMALITAKRRIEGRVVVILNKSLQANFENEAAKLLRIMAPELSDGSTTVLARAIEKALKFVSMDAYNMADQVVDKVRSLENKLIIMDEAHLFFRAIINSGGAETNARRLYNMIMATKSVRLIFMTGTPISKTPFECVPCFNMLMGAELLPTQYDAFMNLYVDREKNRIKNVQKLADRLLGMVSFMKLPALKAREIGGQPEMLPMIIERVEMSDIQYRRYLVARELERREMAGENEKKGRAGPPPSLSLPAGERGGAVGTFFVRSRIISNFSPKGVYTSVDEVPDDEIIPENAPKIVKIIDNLDKYPLPGIIFSEFVHLGGLGIIARYLKRAGWEQFRSGDKPKSGIKRYALITGDVDMVERQVIQNAFNEASNKGGANISVVLLSKSGSVGLNFFRVRQIGILGPPWHMSLAYQIFARGSRTNSHDDLPREERDLQTFIYLATENKEVARRAKGESGSVDDMFYAKALKSDALNSQFLRLYEAVSIECAAYGRDDCYSCVPTGQRLYSGPAEADIKRPSPCQRETKVIAREFEIEGKRYAYQKADGVLRIYEFDSALDAFVELDSTGATYATVKSNIPK